MNAHTPGPWTATENTYNGQWNVGRRDNGYKSLIADCSNILGNGGTAEGNAQLIAAAPDMAEALRAVLANHTTEEIDYFPALSMARDALAKAGL